MKIELDNKKLIKVAATVILWLAIPFSGYKTYRHFKPKKKHTQSLQIIQLKRNDAGYPTWVLVRDNHEIFLMEFDNDIPTISGGLRLKDIIYIDHGPYRHLVKILFY